MAADGRSAVTPRDISTRGWWAVLKRTYAESNRDNVSVIAAGVAFYAFLAIAPTLAAVVLTYGIFADAATVVRHAEALAGSLPRDAASLIVDQLRTVVTGSKDTKGLALALAILLAFYGATKGAAAIVAAVNVAYEEEEDRSFVRLNLTVIAITLAGVVLAVIGLIGMSMLGYLQAIFPSVTGVGEIAIRVLSSVLLVALAAAGAAALYRWGPARAAAQWRWLTPGSLVAATLWGAATWAFGLYTANFADYGATYGSLGAVVGLLTWLYLSAYLFIMGAELNSELERQTERDTTTGPERPMGARDAVMADTVAPPEQEAG